MNFGFLAKIVPLLIKEHQKIVGQMNGQTNQDPRTENSEQVIIYSLCVILIATNNKHVCGNFHLYLLKCKQQWEYRLIRLAFLHNLLH